MKKILFILLTGALALSLWFNWRKRPSIVYVVPTAPGPTETSTSVMPIKVEEIDFSGTGLADEAWQLKTPSVEEKIPLAVPVGEDDGQKLRPPAPEAWNPDVELKLDSRPP